MPKQKKKKLRRRPPDPERSSGSAPARRRQPLPRLKTADRPARPPAPGDVIPEAVTEIVESLFRVCRTARQDNFIVLHDWLGMLEPALRLYPDNALSLAATGHFIEDPPAVKEHYRRARERYLRATEKYPAAYREMQEAFSLTTALLQAAAGAGIWPYCGQSTVNPDLIGQVFLAVTNPDPSWWPYFPTWADALAGAEAAIPDGHELIMEVLLQGHLVYRDTAPEPILNPEPGERFEQWYAEVLPSCEPVVIGPQLIHSSAEMLAAATRFPPWAVASGLVYFHPETAHPLLAQMNQINSYLYGLNGYDLKLAQTAVEILDLRQQQARRPALPPEPEPVSPAAETGEQAEGSPDQAAFDLASPEMVDTLLHRGAASAARLRPPGAAEQPTFAELFRRRG
jgi:hypothetical protein